MSGGAKQHNIGGIMDSLIFDLHSGQPIMFQPMYKKEQFKTFFVGFEKNKYVIIKLPPISYCKMKGLFDHIQNGDSITVKYLSSGAIYAFECRVIKYIISPYPLLFLTFPGKIEALELRKSKRIVCAMQCFVMAQKERLEGMMLDISDEGCLVAVNSLLQEELGDIQEGDEISITCSLLGAEDDKIIHGVVKRFEKKNKNLMVGVEYGNLDPGVAERVQSYIDSMNDYNDA